MDQKQTIVILISALLAVIVVSGAVLYMLPTTSNFSNPNSATRPSDESSIPSGGFDLNVLDRTGYRSLNQAPIQDGSLPVAPPAQVGKPNPFL